MKAEKKAEAKQATINKNGLIKVKFASGKIHEYMPQLAQKLVEKKAAEYV